MDEMNITPFSSSHPQRLFEAVAWSESTRTIGLLQRNNILNEATSSRFPQLSIQRTPHDIITPPHPPSLYHNDVYSIGSRLRVPGSSGEPPALSLYIYIHMNELSGRILSHASRELNMVVYRRLGILLFGMLTCLTNRTFTGNVGNPTINQ